jgi:hypothetical protein
MRFSLRSMFVIVTLAAMICGLIAWLRGQHYVQLRTVNSVLAEYPEIGNVWLITNDDVTLEVEHLYFSTIDQPGVTYGIYGIDGASKSEIRKRLDDALRERRPVARPGYAAQYPR